MPRCRLVVPAFASTLFLACAVQSQNPPVDNLQLCTNLKNQLTRDFKCDPWRVRDRAPVSPDAEVVVLRGGGEPAEFGIFVVGQSDGARRLTLDRLLDFGGDEVRLIGAEGGAARVTVYANSDYGIIARRVKYFFDLGAATVEAAIEYEDQPVLQIAERDGLLLLVGERLCSLLRSTEKGKYSAQVLDRNTDGWWRAISDGPPGNSDEEFPSSGLLPNDGWAGWRVLNPPAAGPEAIIQFDGEESLKTRVIRPAGRFGSSGGVVTGGIVFKQLPEPSPEEFRTFRPEQARYLQEPSFDLSIGGWQVVDHQILFSIDFYDGEGMSGIGGYGVYDVDSRQYEMHYLPEAAEWSSPTLLVSGDEIWLPLVRRPEGARHGGGLLRHNRVTGETTRFEIPEIIHTIARLEDRVYVGTANGIGIVADGKLTRATFNIDQTGRYYLQFEE